MTTIKYLSVEGTPKNMGLAHGEEFKDKILFLLEERTTLLFKCLPSLTLEQLRRTCQKQYNYFKLHCPTLEEEVSSIAKAANIKPYQLVQAGGYTDLLDSLGINHGYNLSECSIAMRPEEGYMAGTWDSHPSAIEGLILLKRAPANTALRTLALTTAGWPAQQGINSSGLAFSITNLTPRRARKRGMNYIAANAVMSTCANIENFLQFAEKVKFCSGHSYLILDSNNRSCVIETSADRFISRVLLEPYIMTNHYRLYPKLDDNSNYRYLDGSINRQIEMEKTSLGFSSPQEFSKSMSQSLHVNKKDLHGVSVTCAYFFLVPKKQELYFSKGPSYGGLMTKVVLD